MYRVYIPHHKRVILVHTQDFKKCGTHKRPGDPAPLDGLSRQICIGESLDESGEAEVLLHRAFQIHLPTLQASHLSRSRKCRDPEVPRSFKEAILPPKWRCAIDPEKNALTRRGIWRYVHRTKDMKPVPFTWVLKLKSLNKNTTEFLYVARC